MARDDSEYVSHLSFKNVLGRAFWNFCSVFLFKPFPSKIFRRWRNFVLRLFGAKIHARAGVYSSAVIYAPWNLIMERNACLGPHSICYNVDIIHLGEYVTVSQYAQLCTASHDINKKSNDLLTAPIRIENNAWIAWNAFVGMGVTVGEGAVVGAKSCVYKNVEPWTVVGGNPAKVIKKREFKK